MSADTGVARSSGSKGLTNIGFARLPTVGSTGLRAFRPAGFQNRTDTAVRLEPASFRTEPTRFRPEPTGFSSLFRQVVQQLEDVRKDAHRGHVRAGARALHDERRARVMLRRERDDVVAPFHAGEGMPFRILQETRAGAAPLERTDIDG